MFSKSLTTRLKEENEREQQQSGATQLNSSQCERLIRTVSCKHETNHAVRKSNINVLQLFDDVKLYRSPSTNVPSLSSGSGAVGDISVTSPVGGGGSSLDASAAGSCKLPRRNESMRSKQAGELPPDASEINFRDLLEVILDNLALTSVTQWFSPACCSSSISSSGCLISNASCLSKSNKSVYLSVTPNGASPASATAATPAETSGGGGGGGGGGAAEAVRGNLYESIQLALNHIDFNLKRNSDFINELTKLLDTSRAIKQEAQLKKVIKLLDEQRSAAAAVAASASVASVNVAPPSPSPSGSSATMGRESKKDASNDGATMSLKSKSKSFKGFSLTSKSKSRERPSLLVTTGAHTLDGRAASSSYTSGAGTSGNYLAPPSTLAGQTTTTTTTTTMRAESSRDLSQASSLNNIERTFQRQLQLQHMSSEVNNSDYIELEAEVEKISYQLDALFRVWAKLCPGSGAQQPAAATSSSGSEAGFGLGYGFGFGAGGVASPSLAPPPSAADQLKASVEFQQLINGLNSSVVVKELEQSLFRLNWLITSKSGFNEPNWQTSVLSLTPSTIDSFIGVNLLKNYYRYVRYACVSYKLFTRQLQLVQLGALLLGIVHRVLAHYRETCTLASISGGVAGCIGQSQASSSCSPPEANPHTLLSFTFSADKYKPISWSANHVTLYANTHQPPHQTAAAAAAVTPRLNNSSGGSNSNVAAATGAETATTGGVSAAISSVSRSSSTRRGVGGAPLQHTAAGHGTTAAQHQHHVSREDQIRQIKNELFMRELAEFVSLSATRLNVQATLANRIGYFYIVNQSTGLVLQAVDFTSSMPLKDQIEQNQKRLQQSSSIKNSSARLTTAGGAAASGGANLVSKGPRFYLTPKANKTAAASASATTAGANRSPPSLATLGVSSAGAAAAGVSSSVTSSLNAETANDEQLWYYYLINGCVANKVIRSGYCLAASSLNAKSPVCFWPNVKTTNCSWFFNSQEQTIVSGLSDELVLDYMIVDEPPNQRYAVVIDSKVPNKASQKWTFEFC